MSKSKNKITNIIVNLFIISLLVISGLVWTRVYQSYSEGQSKELTVAFLNVGQGDSILITTPNKKNILIDGGTYPREWSNFDAGKIIVVPYLREKGIKKLDLVIATHLDLDHIGGLIAVVNKILLEKFLDSGAIATTQTYEDLLNLIDKKKIKYDIAQPGPLLIDPAIKLEILSPISPAFADNPNENSIVIKLEYKKISFLLTGDIGKTAEMLYTEKYKDLLKSNILKLAHHGGKSSTCQTFLNTVQPETAIISCGENNPFGHPAIEVLERIKQMAIPIYRTDKNGSIIIETNGEEYTILTQR